MNQASLHRPIASARAESDKRSDFEGPFQLRMAGNLTLVKELFFTLYPQEKYPKAFEKLVSQFPLLFKEKPQNLK